MEQDNIEKGGHTSSPEDGFETKTPLFGSPIPVTTANDYSLFPLRKMSVFSCGRAKLLAQILQAPGTKQNKSNVRVSLPCIRLVTAHIIHIDSAKRLLNLFYTARYTHVAEKLLTFTATRNVTLDHVNTIILYYACLFTYSFVTL
jgi:hypothetical protein